MIHILNYANFSVYSLMLAVAVAQSSSSSIVIGHILCIFVCRDCVNPVTGTGCRSVQINDFITLNMLPFSQSPLTPLREPLAISEVGFYRLVCCVWSPRSLYNASTSIRGLALVSCYYS